MHALRAQPKHCTHPHSGFRTYTHRHTNTHAHTQGTSESYREDVQTNPYVALLSRSPLSLSADSLYCERLIHMHTPLRLVGLDFGAYFGGYEGFEVRILGRWFDVLLYPYPVMFRHKRTHIQNKTPTPTRTHYRQAWKRVQGNRMSRWNEQWLDLRCLDTLSLIHI